MTFGIRPRPDCSAAEAAIFCQRFFVRPGDAARGREADQLASAQLRGLLNDMLEFIGLCKRHIDAAKNARFRARRRFALHNQRNLLRRNIADHALKVRSLCVADRNALAGFEPQHSGMRRIFPGQNQESRARRSLGSKKLWHRAFLPFP